MDPTTTEHDYRFPRRPDERSTNHTRMDSSTLASAQAQSNGSGSASGSGSGSGRPARASFRKDMNLGNDDLLSSALFPALRGSESGAPSAVDQLQQQDPLAAQVWKFFAKTKQQLPNQQRMENLTWRMMALSMRKRSQDEQK